MPPQTNHPKQTREQAQEIVNLLEHQIDPNNSTSMDAYWLAMQMLFGPEESVKYLYRLAK
jgi:hypothetical protein